MSYAYRVLSAAGPKGVTNMLTANMASGTDTLSDTTGFIAGTSTTIASSTAVTPPQGSRSLEVTMTSTVNVFVYSYSTGTGGLPISADTQYTGSVQVRQGDAVSGAHYLRIVADWYQSGGSASSTPTTTSDVLLTTTTTFQQGTWLFTSPSDAAYVRIRWTTQSNMVAGYTFYFDELGWWPGTSTEWAMP